MKKSKEYRSQTKSKNHDFVLPTITQLNMDERIFLLVVSFFVWNGVVMGGKMTKTVNRKGLNSVYSQVHESNGVNKQWNPSLGKNEKQLVKIKELVGSDKFDDKLIGYSKLGHSNGIKLVSQHLEIHKYIVRSSMVDEDSNIKDSKEMHETKKNRNNTKPLEYYPKSERFAKEIVLHRKVDPNSHLNKTKSKSFPSFKETTSPEISNNAINPKHEPSESPHRLNLTRDFGVLKLISKENLVRIVNSQLQNGLNFQTKINHSKKRDLINIDSSHLKEMKVKRYDTRNTNNHEFDNHNKTIESYSSSITRPNTIPIQISHSHGKPIPDLKSELKEEEKIRELKGIASNVLTKHYNAASPSPSEVVANTESNPFNIHSNTSLPEGISHVSTHQMSKMSDSLDSHILKLHPNSDWNKGLLKKDSWDVTVDTTSGLGLVFQEMVDTQAMESNPPGRGKGSRSRSRRSWIWNQFFVIEEYDGPEPVLIGRVRVKIEARCLLPIPFMNALDHLVSVINYVTDCLNLWIVFLT